MEEFLEESACSRKLPYLPNEILIQILTPLLGHNLTQLKLWGGGLCEHLDWDILKNKFGEGQFIQIFPPLPKEDQVQVQVLRVCRQFREVGTRILYDSTLMFHSMERRKLPFCSHQREKGNEFLAQLGSRRRHRLRKIIILVPTVPKDRFLGPFRPGPRSPGPYGVGAVLDEECTYLASHQPIWDQIYFYQVERFACSPYSQTRLHIGRLIYGLGRLHGKDVDGYSWRDEATKDMCWAMQQPKHTIPLWHVHKELSRYLGAYDPGQEFAGRGLTLKEFFISQSKDSADSQDIDRFYQNMEVVVDYVETIVSQGLASARLTLRSEEDDIKDPKQKILNRVRRDGQILLSARNGLWRGDIVIMRLRPS